MDHFDEIQIWQHSKYSLTRVKSCTFWYIECLSASPCTRVLHFKKWSIFWPNPYNNVLLPIIIITTIRYCYCCCYRCIIVLLYRWFTINDDWM